MFNEPSILASAPATKLARVTSTAACSFKTPAKCKVKATGSDKRKTARAWSSSQQSAATMSMDVAFEFVTASETLAMAFSRILRPTSTNRRMLNCFATKFKCIAPNAPSPPMMTHDAPDANMWTSRDSPRRYARRSRGVDTDASRTMSSRSANTLSSSVIR